MGAYAAVRQKILEVGAITQIDAADFFKDLWNLSVDRVHQEAGAAYSHYLPTNQYRGPGGRTDVPNGWKSGHPIGVCDHFTASDSHASALRWFSSYPKWSKGGGVVGASNASAALVVALEGEPFCLIDFWNGKSDWHEPQLNGVCVGIEHVNVGEVRQKDDGQFYWWPANWGTLYPYMTTLPPQDVGGWRGCHFMQPFTREQVVTNLVLKRALVALYKPGAIRAELCVDHAMYRDDKTDQGPLWPLEDLRRLMFSHEPLNSELDWLGQFPSASGVPHANSLDLGSMHHTVALESGTVLPLDLDDFPTAKSQVLAIQLGLQSLGYQTLADGICSAVYLMQVRKFQGEHGLTADGITGPQTRAALKAAMEKVDV